MILCTTLFMVACNDQSLDLAGHHQNLRSAKVPKQDDDMNNVLFENIPYIITTTQNSRPYYLSVNSNNNLILEDLYDGISKPTLWHFKHIVGKPELYSIQLMNRPEINLINAYRTHSSLPSPQRFSFTEQEWDIFVFEIPYFVIGTNTIPGFSSSYLRYQDRSVYATDYEDHNFSHFRWKMVPDGLYEFQNITYSPYYDDLDVDIETQELEPMIITNHSDQEELYRFEVAAEAIEESFFYEPPRLLFPITEKPVYVGVTTIKERVIDLNTMTPPNWVFGERTYQKKRHTSGFMSMLIPTRSSITAYRTMKEYYASAIYLATFKSKSTGGVISIKGFWSGMQSEFIFRITTKNLKGDIIKTTETKVLAGETIDLTK